MAAWQSSGRVDGYAPIGDYAIVGDTRTAALIARDGSVDWLCLPRFDSSSVFAALLDARRGGRLSVSPVGVLGTSRRYLRDTNVLETTFRTQSGEVVVRDAMTVADTPHAEPRPGRELLREIECRAGSVEMEVRFEPRPGYGRRAARLEDRGRLGIRFVDAPMSVSLLADGPLRVASDRASAAGSWPMSAGDVHYASLAADDEAPAVLPALGPAARRRLEQTAAWWREWASRCTYAGPYREAVVRSALVLKLLAYSPSGAIIAAPTTSLPEEIGGGRNFDYRYCWLRDAAFLVRALQSIGFAPLAHSFFSWMLHATRLTHPELQVIYDVYGRANLDERPLDHLEGYRGSRPVRIGNDACHQFQLDVYGELLDAALQLARDDDRLDGEQQDMLIGFAETVCRRWQEPDHGIWESRTQPEHYVHSKVACWVALDRIVTLHDDGLLERDVERYRGVRDEIRAAIEERGYDGDTGTYVRCFGSRQMDGSLLTLPLLGYLAASDERMRRTFERLTAELASGPLYRRYASAIDDGMPGDEASFGICSFWAVEYRALAGDVGGAREAFEQLLGYANDVGLYGEQIEPASGAPLGNFPQGLTHIGVINAALALERSDGEATEVAS